MINVKDQVAQAILRAVPNGEVSDLYPQEDTAFPAVQYSEEANNVFEKTDEEEQLARLRYRIDIWDRASTSPTAMAIDREVSALGLTRVECADVPDPSGLRHKQMRYDGVIDVKSQTVYWYGSN
jgi:hypothetical protein